MHDTFLLKKIVGSVEELCKEQGIAQVSSIKVDVHTKSHVNEDSLLKELCSSMPCLIKDTTKVIVKRNDDIEELTAIIEYIEGIN